MIYSQSQGAVTCQASQDVSSANRFHLWEDTEWTGSLTVDTIVLRSDGTNLVMDREGSGVVVSLYSFRPSLYGVAVTGGDWQFAYIGTEGALKSLEFLEFPPSEAPPTIFFVLDSVVRG